MPKRKRAFSYNVFPKGNTIFLYEPFSKLGLRTCWMKNNLENFTTGVLHAPLHWQLLSQLRIRRLHIFLVSPITYNLWCPLRNPPEVNHLLQRHNPMCEAFPRVSEFNCSFCLCEILHSCWPVSPLLNPDLKKSKGFISGQFWSEQITKKCKECGQK